MPQIRPQIHSAILGQYRWKLKVIKHFPNVYINHVRLWTHHHNQTDHLLQHEVWSPQGIVPLATNFLILLATFSLTEGLLSSLLGIIHLCGDSLIQVLTLSRARTREPAGHLQKKGACPSTHSHQKAACTLGRVSRIEIKSIYNLFDLPLSYLLDYLLLPVFQPPPQISSLPCPIKPSILPPYPLEHNTDDLTFPPPEIEHAQPFRGYLYLLD